MFRVLFIVGCLFASGSVSAASCKNVGELAKTVMFSRQYMPADLQTRMIAVGSPERVRVAHRLIEEAYHWPKVPSTMWNATAARFAAMSQIECRRSGTSW